MPETPTRVHFKAFDADVCRWTGTNQAELAATFGDGFEEHLVDQPLIVGHLLYRPDGQSAIFVASQRVVDTHGEPIEETHRG